MFQFVPLDFFSYTPSSDVRIKHINEVVYTACVFSDNLNDELYEFGALLPARFHPSERQVIQNLLR